MTDRSIDANPPQAGRAVRAAIWLPGLAVALGAAAATAHGLYEVTLAARVPAGIAWLYPLITDGLALVAYAATARLAGPAARYAWAVVVTAAGLSGLAQAAYLAGGPAVEVAPALRFGVGAWPAVAAAVVAHLLYLLATADPSHAEAVQTRPASKEQFDPLAVQSDDVQSPLFTASTVQPQAQPAVVQPHPAGERDPATPGPVEDASTGGQAPRPAPSPARDRAEAAAMRLAQRHGAWPTVTEVEAAARVSRGTAASALKALRDRPLPLHLINTIDSDTTDEAHP